MITHLSHWITVKEYAARHKIKMRTVHDRIRRREVGFEKYGGNKMIFDRDAWNKIKVEDRPHIPINKLQPVLRFATIHKFSPDTIYQHIIMGTIDAVVMGNLVLVNPEDETVIDFLKNHKPLKRK